MTGKTSVNRKQLLDAYMDMLKENGLSSNFFVKEISIDNNGIFRPIVQQKYKPNGPEKEKLADIKDKLNNRYELIRSLEKEIIHIDTCIHSMDDTLRLLKTINAQPMDNPLRKPAFRLALVSYCKSYTDSKTEKNHQNKGDPYKLHESFIPENHKELHEWIMVERHEILAHHDIACMDPKLNPYIDMNEELQVPITTNIRDYTQYLSRISEIIDHIEVTLNKMEDHFEELKNQLKGQMLPHVARQDCVI